MMGGSYYDGPKNEWGQYFEGRDAKNDAKNYAHDMRREYQIVAIRKLEGDSYVVIYTLR